MSTNRRDFLKTASAAAVAAACARTVPEAISTAVAPAAQPPQSGDASIRDLAMEALQAAKDAGASYADVRVGKYRRQFVATRERQVTNVSDTESLASGPMKSVPVS